MAQAFHTWSRGTREDSVVVHTGGAAEQRSKSNVSLLLVCHSDKWEITTDGNSRLCFLTFMFFLVFRMIS